MNGFKINKQEPYELTMSYKLPTKISTDINAGYVMENYLKAEGPAYLLFKKIRITQKMYVKVINNRLNSFQEHRKKLHHIQNFISLGVGKPVSIIDVYGKTEENKEQLNESIINPTVKIYFITDKS